MSADEENPETRWNARNLQTTGLLASLSFNSLLEVEINGLQNQSRFCFELLNEQFR